MALLAIAGAQKDNVNYAADVTWADSTYFDGFSSGKYTIDLDVDDNDCNMDVLFHGGAQCGNETYTRFKIKITQALDAGETHDTCIYFTGTRTRYFQVQDDNTLDLYGGTLLGTIGPLTTGTTYEIIHRWRDESGNVLDQVWLDGSLDIDTTSGAYENQRFAKIRFGENLPKGGSIGLKYELSDIWVNDTTGSNHNGSPPDVQIGEVILDGDDASFQDFTYGAATADYQDWDDPDTGNDGDFSYAESGTGTGAKNQLSTLESASAAGVDGTNYHIEAVQTRAVYKVTTGSNGSCGVLVRDGGTNYKTTTRLDDYHAGYLSTFWAVRCDSVQPNSGDAWTNSAFAGFEAGAYREAAASDPRNYRVTALYVTLAREAGAEPAAGAWTHQAHVI